MCCWAARVVAKLDRDEQLDFLPLRNEQATALLADVPESERDASWHLVRAGRPTVGYGVGGRELLLTLRLTKPFGLLLGVVPNRVLDGVYRLIARHRSSLGRVVPDRPGPRRYP